MNRITQQFIDEQLEAKYFEDQYSELLDFFLWTCYLGTLSAIAVFLMEFVSPFNFGNIKYALLLIPFLFLISYRIISKYPHYFNLILGSMNLSLGLMIDVLLILFIDTEYLFLAGQTVALVQYSLLIGTNVFANLVILIINQVALILINSYFQNYFTSLQIMFILALVLVMKSIWTNSKMKRQFFLQRYLNEEIQDSLDNCFDIGIAKCMFDVRSQQIKLISVNQSMSQQFIRQKEFTEFIREYSISQTRSFNFKNLEISFSSHQHSLNQSLLTLELFLFREFQKKSKELQTQFLIKSKTKNTHFKVCLSSTIKKQQMVIILMILEQKQTQKILHLQQKLKVKQQHLRYFVEINKQIRQVIKNTQSIIQKNTKLQKLFQSPLSTLYEMLHQYYNILLINRYIKIGDIVSFHIEQLPLDLQNIYYHHFLQNNISVEYFFDKQLICSTDYLLLLQLILNVLKIYSISINQIQIQIRQINIQNINCLRFKFEFINYIELYTKVNLDLNYNQINIMILKLIGWNTHIALHKLQTSLSLQFSIIQDLNQFQNALKK